MSCKLFEVDYSLNNIIIINKEILKKRIFDIIEIPRNYQYMFTMIENAMVFPNGETIDLSELRITNQKEILNVASLNPNINIDEKLEEKIKKSISKQLDPREKAKSKMDALAVKGEESNTIMKFIERSLEGKLKFKDYTRKKDNNIEWGDVKTCLIIRSGTAYPDLLCIFKEDAESIQKQGENSISEFCEFIINNYYRFKHLIFAVEAEFNLTSFKSHDVSLNKVLQSKYIFCEYTNDSFYNSKYNVEIPVICIKDLY